MLLPLVRNALSGALGLQAFPGLRPGIVRHPFLRVHPSSLVLLAAMPGAFLPCCSYDFLLLWPWPFLLLLSYSFVPFRDLGVSWLFVSFSITKVQKSIDIAKLFMLNMYLHTLKYVNTYIVFLPLFLVAVARCVPCCADPHLSAVGAGCAAYSVEWWPAVPAMPRTMAEAFCMLGGVVAGAASHDRLKEKGRHGRSLSKGSFVEVR